MLQLEPTYLEVRNEVVRPDQVTVTTRYFWARWVPRLAPLATCLLLRLRQYCYFNRETGERRDWCFPSQQTLAIELGIRKRHTVSAALRDLEAYGFVKREPTYHYDETIGKRVRGADLYHVLMDDPLVPEDEGEAFVRAAERIARTARQVPIPGLDGPKAEKRPQVDPPKAEKRPAESAGRKTARKGYVEEVLKPVNVATPSRNGHDQQQHLVAALIEELGDPRSQGFYRMVAARLPAESIWTALSEVRDARRTGRLRKSAGAYFTHLAKRTAAQLGISLEARERA